MENDINKGKVVLITGGGSGIGRATCLAFARTGAQVVISDIDRNNGEKTLSEVREYHDQIIFIESDVSQSKNVQSLIQKVIHSYGKIDFAFNNAGISGEIALTADCTEKNWEHVINTNLKSIWLCMKYEIPHMLSKRNGVIINSSSVYGLVGCKKGLSVYSASKHAIIGLTKSAALEYAQTGIRINAICAGAINTPFRDKLGKDYIESSINDRRYPIGRFGTPNEVANTVLWLCSKEASFITGSVITVDGGLTAG